MHLYVCVHNTIHVMHIRTYILKTHIYVFYINISHFPVLCFNLNLNFLESVYIYLLKPCLYIHIWVLYESKTLRCLGCIHSPAPKHKITHENYLFYGSTFRVKQWSKGRFMHCLNYFPIWMNTVIKSKAMWFVSSLYLKCKVSHVFFRFHHMYWCG